MKREWYETLESPGLVLKLTQPDEMIHALFEGFDVSVQHRRVRPDAHLVNSSGDFQPALAGNLVSGNQGSRTFGKNLRSAAGAASKSGLTDSLDNPLERLASDFGEEIQLHHREGFQMYLGETASQTFK